MYMYAICISIVVAAIVSCAATRIEIPILRKKQMGQNIREEGPESHKAKAGTPSMGGIALIGAAVLSAIVMGAIFKCLDGTMAVMIIVTVLFAVVGFLDDYLKKMKKQNEGLNPKQKMIFLLVVSVAVSIWAYIVNDACVYIPFADRYISFGILYIPFIIFAIIAMTNAVNLTDGLDGLASGCSAISALFFACIANLAGAPNTAIFAACIVGGCVGFLVWNKNPAKVFMGDTGSLALGGALVIAAISLRMELFLLLVGLVYVIEALSVVIQVTYFKKTGGKRVFPITPIHHSFEKIDKATGNTDAKLWPFFEKIEWSEKKIDIVFWSFTLVCCLIGLLIYTI